MNLLRKRLAVLWRLGIILAVLLLAGCDSLSLPFGFPAVTESPSGTGLPADPGTPGQITATVPPATTPSSTLTAPAQLVLRAWVPPQFDPDSGAPEGDLLAAQLAEFSQRRPNLSVDVRLKTVEGQAGMIPWLTAANAAAPLALPDLVLLPRQQLETAVLKGLVFAYEPSSLESMPDWYSFALQFSQLQGSTYGVPLASDVLLLAYRPSQVAQPPQTWEEVLAQPNVLLFPAADPQALVTLALYRAVGGEIQDAEGRPVLQRAPLEQALAFLAQAQTGGQMPFWLTTYESNAQSWAAFEEGRSAMTLVWASQALAIEDSDLALAALPVPAGDAGYTLGSGWMWVLTHPDPARRASAAQLADFLTQTEFNAAWTEAAAVLPIRPDALLAWDDVQQRSLFDDILSSAAPFPGQDVLNIIGPLLRQATVQVLKSERTPQGAATEAVEALAQP